MGNASSSEKIVEEERAFDPRRIYFDASGNLRHGIFCKKNCEDVLMTTGEKIPDREEEMRRIMDVDVTDDSEITTWYIINTPWINSWVQYVHASKGICPAPGPCRNECLLIADHENQKWVPRPDLVMARKNKTGDYRRITKEAWQVYCELYPGSGPAISVDFVEDPTHIGDGKYDTSSWVIDQKEFPKENTNTPKKRSLLPSLGKNVTPINETKNMMHSTSASSTPASPQPTEMEDDTITEESRRKISAFFGKSHRDDSVDDSERITIEMGKLEKTEDWLFGEEKKK